MIDNINVVSQGKVFFMKVSNVTFKGKFVIPNNKTNKKIKYFYNKVVELGKDVQATTVVSNDEVVINSYKSKDDFIRNSLKKLGLEFKELSK